MIHWAGRIEKELEKVLQHVTGTQQMRSAQQTAVLESDGGEEEGRKGFGHHQGQAHRTFGQHHLSEG
ncbi:hypothetical protein KUCAC02_030754, partial [Chaenocephalus aceratus]